VEVVASLSQGRTAAAQCGLFTHKSVPVIFEPPCNWNFCPCLEDVSKTAWLIKALLVSLMCTYYRTERNKRRPDPVVTYAL